MNSYLCALPRFKRAADGFKRDARECIGRLFEQVEDEVRRRARLAQCFDKMLAEQGDVGVGAGHINFVYAHTVRRFPPVSGQ